jgi:arylsulfatase A-like enzyme
MRYPREVEPLVVTDSVASLVDVVPTLIELGQGRVPPAMQGQSLVPALRGKPLARNHAFVETGTGAAVRTPTHLYHVSMESGTRSLGEAPTRFHDLVRDPYELNNLAGTGVEKAAARSCDDLLREWDAVTPWLGAGSAAGP